MNLLNHSNFSGALSPTACREREVFVWSHFAPYRCPECYARFSSKINLDCKVYVGDLPRDASEKELERCFSYYGPLRSVWVARNPAGFAFVEFEDPRDSEDAVRALDGTTMCGVRVRVEHSTGKVRPKPWMRGSRGPPRPRKPFHPNDKCYECGEKGHYAYDCYRYRRKRSSRYRGRSRSRSRSRSRRRSYSRSRSRSSSRSRSRSPPSHSKSRSYSRSPSRSRSHSHGRETPSKNGNEKYKA